MALKSTPYTLYLATVVSLGGFLFGFDASVISGVIRYATYTFDLNDWQIGLLVGAPTLGAIPAGLLAGPLSDCFGRKRVLLVIAFLYTLSAITSAFAPTFEILVAARITGGLAFCSLMLAPLYIAEIAPAGLRGRLVSINQMNIVVGFSAAYFSNYLILKISGSSAEWVSMLHIADLPWRWMLGLEIIPALAYFLFLFGIPESPRWLLVKNRKKAAREILLRLDPDSGVEARISQIGDSIEKSRNVSKSHIRLLFTPALRLPLLIGLIVGIVQQITGVNAIYFYAPGIFEQSGVGTDAAFAQAIWIGLTNIIFTLIAMVTIDRFGRKPLLIVGLSGVLISMFVAAHGFANATYTLTPESVQTLEAIEPEQLKDLVGREFISDVEFKQALTNTLGEFEAKQHEAALIQAAVKLNPTQILVGILGFVASFAVSLGPVMWVLFSELFPNRIRGLVISFVGFFNSLVSFGVQFLFPWQLSNLGAAGTFLTYGLFALIGLILVIWILPETKGKSLEELEAFFSR